MKKLLFVMAFGLAGGLVSANTVKENNSMKKDIELSLKMNNLVQVQDHAWVAVETWCGKVFFLDLNHYSNEQGLYSDASYFTDQQCGTQSTFTPLYI